MIIWVALVLNGIVGFFVVVGLGTSLEKSDVKGSVGALIGIVLKVITVYALWTVLP